MKARIRWAVPSLNRGQSAWLDVTRAFAAILVVIHHVRNLFFVNYPAVKAPLNFRETTKAVYYLTSLGHPAVMVFFVLSGFLISGSVLKSLDRGYWSWSWYLVQRLTRLWVVLLPALLLCAVWDALGIRTFGATGVYGGLASNRYILWWSVPSHSSIGILLGNVLFLQDMHVPTFGSDGPLWSLANEFWYYMLFPACLLLLVGRGRLQRSLMIIVLAVAVVIALPVLPYYPIWLLGVAVLLVPCIRLSAYFLRWGSLLLAFALTGSVLIASRSVQNLLLSDTLVSTAFAVSLYLLLCASARERTAKVPAKPGVVAAASQRWASGLAGFSYTLYLVHFPMLVFVQATFTHFGIGRWQPDVKHLALGALMVPPTLLYAWLISRVTEARTAAIREFVWTRLLKQPGTVQVQHELPQNLGKVLQPLESTVVVPAAGVE